MSIDMDTFETALEVSGPEPEPEDQADSNFTEEPGAGAADHGNASTESPVEETSPPETEQSTITT